MQGLNENKDWKLTNYHCIIPGREVWRKHLHTTESMSSWTVPPLDSMDVAKDAKGGICKIENNQRYLK
ncbi:MAG: hypothetical protein ACRCW3_03065, partial [Metamycoplasmataceae bacterium]